MVMHIVFSGSNAEATETYSLSHTQDEPTSLAARNRCPTVYFRNWHMASSRVPLGNCMDNRHDSDIFRGAMSGQSLQFADADISFMYAIKLVGGKCNANRGYFMVHKAASTLPRSSCSKHMPCSFSTPALPYSHHTS